MNSEDSACIRDAAISHMNSVGNELYEAAEKLNSFAVAYKLVPFRDGNQWCVLFGSDIQSGVAGFGDTPAKAIADFERAMHAPISDLSAPAAVKQSLTTDERTAAEETYTRRAFDYEQNPVGSRDWTLFWSGWCARAVQSAQPVSEDYKSEAQAVADDVVLDDLLARWCEFATRMRVRGQPTPRPLLDETLELLAAQQQKAGGE